MNRAGLFFLVYVFALFNSFVCAAEETSGGDVVLPVEASRAKYLGETGTEVGLYRSDESSQWVMTLREPGGQPLTLLLEGQPSLMKPSSLDFSVDFDGEPMQVTATGNRLYARVTKEGRTLECLRDAKGSRTAMNGERSKSRGATPEEMESTMMLNEVAGRWEVMKQMAVSVGTNGLAIGRGTEPVSRSRLFTRTGVLSRQETKLMEDKLAVHAKMADESSAFLDREQKSEGDK